MSNEPKKIFFVRQIREGGGLNAGEQMYADMDLVDEKTVRLVISYESMEVCVAALLAFSGVVNGQRAQRNAPLGPGLAITGCHVAPDTTRALLDLRLRCRVGMSEVDMPTAVLSAAESRQLAASLLKWADQIDPPRRAD